MRYVFLKESFPESSARTLFILWNVWHSNIIKVSQAENGNINNTSCFHLRCIHMYGARGSLQAEIHAVVVGSCRWNIYQLLLACSQAAAYVNTAPPESQHSPPLLPLSDIRPVEKMLHGFTAGCQAWTVWFFIYLFFFMCVTLRCIYSTSVMIFLLFYCLPLL